MPPLAVDPALEVRLLEVIAQVAAPQPGLPARNVLPAANQQEQASLDGAGPTGMKVFQIGHYVWVPYQALTYWPRYKREIERCLVQHGGKSAEEARRVGRGEDPPTFWRW
jgi:hypothetical protein